jgi:hypothetical protein
MNQRKEAKKQFLMISCGECKIPLGTGSWDTFVFYFFLFLAYRWERAARDDSLETRPAHPARAC